MRNKIMLHEIIQDLLFAFESVSDIVKKKIKMMCRYIFIYGHFHNNWRYTAQFYTLSIVCISVITNQLSLLLMHINKTNLIDLK